MSETPKHYAGQIQPIEYLKAVLTPEEYAGFCKGNIIKYISRAGKKGDATADIIKAGDYVTYLQENCAYEAKNADSGGIIKRFTLHEWLLTIIVVLQFVVVAIGFAK